MKKIIQTQDRKNLSDALEKNEPSLQLRTERITPPGTVDQKSRTIQYILSDESVDHAGDIIRQAGWDFSTFIKNPVLPWCHDYADLPLGGWQDLRVENNQLLGVAKYASPEDYPFADTVFKLSAAGFLRGVSVGFNPKKWNSMRNDQQGFLGYEFIEQVLLECSACTVPCNPNAMAKSVGDNVISRKELAEVVTRQVLAQFNLDPSDHAAAKSELLPRIASLETEVETLKTILSENADADGKPATSPAAASPEVARVLDLIAAIKTLS